MLTFIAGAMTRGAVLARAVQESMSSAEPRARRARVVAEVGQTTITSASAPRVTWALERSGVKA